MPLRMKYCMQCSCYEFTIMRKLCVCVFLVLAKQVKNKREGGTRKFLYMPPKPQQQQRVRGRSTSVEVRSRGYMSRSDVLAFAGTLSAKDKYTITWRMTNPAEAANAEATAAVPWSTWTGEVKDRDDQGWSVLYTDEAGANVGLFNLPPPEVEDGHIEVRSLVKIVVPLTLRSLAKRQREETQIREPALPNIGLQIVRDFTEAVTGQQMATKFEVAPGLRIEDNMNEKFLPFETWHWLTLTKANPDSFSVAIAWKAALGCMGKSG